MDDAQTGTGDAEKAPQSQVDGSPEDTGPDDGADSSADAGAESAEEGAAAMATAEDAIVEERSDPT